MRLIVLFVLALSLILAARFVFYFQHLKTFQPGDTFESRITLLSEPRVSSFYQTFRVDSLTIQVPKDPRYHYGDTLVISGKVEKNSFEDKKGKTVNQLLVKNPQVQLEKTHILIKTAAFLRSRIQETFQRFLPQNEAALLFGIVFGGTQGITRDSQDAFRNSGVLHVVAASGMNVSMVAAFLIAVLSYFLKRQTALALAILGVFYYALLSGFSPSILRASLMATVAFSAGILGRQNYAYFALFVTVFIMLILNPGTLFDIGFLLSFTSTVGILLFKPLFDGIKLIHQTKAFSDDLTTTVSAQFGSLPLMASAFGSYSLISIVVNALVLWTVPILMILGGAAALCSIALPIASVLFIYLSYPLLLYFETIIHFFGKFNMLQFDSLPGSLIVGYYLILGSLVLILQNKVKRQNPKGKSTIQK